MRIELAYQIGKKLNIKTELTHIMGQKMSEMIRENVKNSYFAETRK